MSTYTGIRRQRRTSTAVKVTDMAARMFITSAGMGTIVAVSLVCVFLVWVVVPLFQEGSVALDHQIDAPRTDVSAGPDTARADAGVTNSAFGTASSGDAGHLEPIHVTIDEYQVLGYAIFADSTIRVFRLDNGEVIDTRKLFANKAPTCWSFALRGRHVVFGFEDGTIRFGTIGFKTSYLDLKDVETRHRGMAIDEVAQLGNGLVQMTPLGQYRLQVLDVDLKDPIDLKSNSPVRLVDMSMQASGPIFASVTEDGVFRVNAVREIRNILTETTTYVPSGGQVALPLPEGAGPPTFLKLEGRADSAVIVWKDGYTLRLDTRDKNEPVFAESLDVAPENGAQVTSLGHLIGKTTLVVGESSGRVSTWFRVKPTRLATTTGGGVIVASAETHPPVASRLRAARVEELPGALADRASELLVCSTPDASVLVRQHVLQGESGSAVTALGASMRNRMLTIGHADGRFDLVYVTSDRLLASASANEAGEPIRVVAMSPKNNGVLIGSADRYELWRIDMPHPETTLNAIFGKVWYEGAEKPEHVWQSTAGDDAFESKFGLMPLIFGTLKATFYTMLFGVPIALMAAIYTSEFLHPRAKSKIKPTVEVMASLPSVVLGFLAALVFAPFVEDVVPAVLLLMVMLPLSVLMGSFVFQLLPHTLGMRLMRGRFVLVALCLPIGAGLAWLIGSTAEQWLFAGDIRGWLAWKPDPVQPDEASPFRDATGGWMIILMPFAALLTSALVVLVVNPRLQARTASMERAGVAAVHMVKFVIATGAAIGLTWVLASVLNGAGFDPRGGIVDTYIQRNALIVGFVMGFAVIPIIYTIAEDALSSVPEHLRAASLGAGATRWQTAVRIIIPTAMSGIFSACMIGLGRAVGETMIVLMAAGNTPIMDWNIFSGFRTLSANIAVEMPEAVENGTNYRMLFLAALTLFAMTFVLNTVAEVVRLRFRRRAFAL